MAETTFVLAHPQVARGFLMRNEGRSVRDQRRIPALMATLLGGYYLPGLLPSP